MIAPLIVDQDSLGIMAFGSSQLGSFTPEDLRLLNSFSITATSAIRNAILHSKIQHLAITDGLTGRYNRRAFLEMGEREIERTRRFQRPLSVVMIDIDNFKEINDQYGHMAGDVVLKEVSDRILSSIRDVDILGRYGGDEFALFLPESDWMNIHEIIRRIMRSVTSSPIQVSGAHLRVTISLGAARTRDDEPSLEQILNQADDALYRAKLDGKNRFEVAE